MSMRRLTVSAGLGALALSLVPLDANAVPLGHWELVRHEVPPAIPVGGQVAVPVRIRNRSGLVWSETTRDRLAYHWLAADGTMVHRDGDRTHLPAALDPGEAVDLVLQVRAPPEPGRYFLQIEPVRENRRWWGMPYLGRDLLIPVEVTGGDLAWSLVRADPIPPLAAGTRTTVAVQLRNAGDTTWSTGSGDRLSHHFIDTDGRRSEGVRTRLPGPVAPGATVDLAAEILAPAEPGRYTLVWEPVREHVRWFGPPRGPSAARATDPTSPPVAPATDPHSPAVAPATDPTSPAPPAASTPPVAPATDPHSPAPDPTSPPVAPSAEFPLVVTPGAGQRITVDVPPLEVHARTFADVDLIVRNAGDALPEDHGLALSYHWRAPDGATLEHDGLRTPLPALAAGEETILTAQLRGPDGPGEAVLEWALVREHVGWYPLAEPVDTPIAVLPPLLAWSLDAAEWPWTLPVARADTMRVRLRNTGLETLSPETGDRIGYRWRDADDRRLADEGIRTPLPRPLDPGRSLAIDVRVAGPEHPGRYTLELGLVREHVAWVPPPKDGRPVSATIQVVRRSARHNLALLLAALVALAAARRRKLSPLALRCGPAGFTWAATFTQTLAFSDLSGTPLWAGGVAVSASVAALPALLVLLCPPLLGRVVALVIVTLTAALLLADLLYMQMLGSIVPLQALRGGHQVGDIGASIRAMLTPDHAWLLVAPLAALALAVAWPSRHVPKTSTRPALATLLVALTPAAFLLALAMAGPLGTRVFSEQHNVGRFGVVGAHLFDGLRTARDRLSRPSLSPEQRAEVFAWFAARPPPPSDAEAARARGMNLLLIQAEAMQGWVLGARVGEQEVTPFLNRLAPESLTYTQLFDETAQGMTSDAEYASLNSQLPLGQGAVAFLRADNNFSTLAHALRDAGYSTLSAHPFKKGFWNRAVVHPRYGFERSLFAEDLGPGPTVGWGLSDSAFFDRMLPELAALPQPWFTFLVTLSLHHPYDHFPDALKTLELGPLERTALGNYLHGMRYLDASLAHLFAELAARGLLDHTVVAIYGDHDSRLPHDAELLRLAGVAETPAASPALALQLDRIAAIVSLPGGQVHGEVAAVGGHVDLAPTLLHYLGVAPPRGFVGRPLLPAVADDGFAVFSDGSAIGPGRVFAAASRALGPGAHGPSEISHDGACFEHPSGRRLDRRACTDLSRRAHALLLISRTVTDHDLARPLARP